MSDPIRVAGIGLGNLGQIELAKYDAMDGVEVVAGADVSESMREEFREQSDVPVYEDYAELLAEHGDELDAANIVTPHTLHHEHASACLEAGLHVFLEKPLTTDIDHARDLVTTARERDLVLVVGYQRHFHPVYQRIRDLLESGRIGDVHALNAYMGQNWIRKFTDAWRTTPSLSGGGQLYDSGSHLLDTVLWTTDSEPVSVAAQMDYRDHDVDVNSALAFQLTRDDRPVTGTVTVTADGAEDPSTYEGLVIWGTEGRLSFTDGTLRIADRGAEPETIPVGEDPGFHELVRRKLTDFVESIRGEHEPAVPGAFGLEVVAFTEAAYEAYESESVVDVRQYLDGE